MREIRIVVEPFEFISFLTVNCVKELNEHGKIEIKGIIPKNKAAEYQFMAYKETWITVKLFNENNDGMIFFRGILTELKIEKENQVNTLSFSAKTGSYLLDLVPHIRSYQKDAYTYDEVIENCLMSDEGKCILYDKRGMNVNRFLIQYRESDWEFIKRVAGYAGVAVIAEERAAGRNICFGYPETIKQESIETDSFDVIQNYEEYQKRKIKNNNGITNNDLYSYKVKSRKIYRLGETVIFQGKRLIIGKICSCLAGQELQHTYILLSRVMGTCSEEDNINITGASLKANVVHVDKAKALIKIQLDENADNAGNRWFDFATVYSTSDGTGWYCMPEVGDEVRLVFPDKSEENAYVSSCVHIENESRMNPDEKSWKNKQGKEVLFTPETLVLRNNKGMSIEISDVEGIKIVSDKKIILQAAEDINVNSESGLQLSAAESMLLSQGGASIQMNDSITIGGGKIYIN